MEALEKKKPNGSDIAAALLKPAEKELILSLTPTPKSLVGKLAEALLAVDSVEKKGRNTQQNYSYVRAADVANAVRKELFRRGVIMTADVEKTEWSEFTTNKGSRMTVCRLTVAYTLHDADSQERITFHGLGEAFDSGDKAVYKAHTGALKYALRTLGLIPDEAADPEADERVDREMASGVSEGLDSGRVLELCEWISNAKDADELKKMFATGFKEAGAARDNSAIKELTRAKDRRKQELGL